MFRASKVGERLVEKVDVGGWVGVKLCSIFSDLIICSILFLHSPLKGLSRVWFILKTLPHGGWVAKVE